MNYQVLARRYRPRHFEEVVGQESIGATLRGAILQERLAHAFLFTGPRGVGKTSMARIFAKALNCPKAADRTHDRSEWAQPCDSCPTCEAIHTGQDIDVVELDGASHRGIEDVRSIIEGVNRPATRGGFKIYIIDEVHMLTREAFNALLKTLEEPPAHVKFVFATTEAHRIPDTILSRCQRFDFHPITEEAIVRRLAQILQAEGRTAEAGLLERIARYGKGGLRDAQTLLDQLMTFCEKTLTVAELDRMTGRVAEDQVCSLGDAVLAGQPGAAFDLLRSAFELGADPAILLEQVLEDFRARLHRAVRAASGAAGRDGPLLDRLIASLQVLMDAAGKLRHSPFAQIAVEVTLLKLARLEDPVALEEVIRLLSETERRDGGPRPSVPPTPTGPSTRPLPRRLEEPPPAPPPAVSSVAPAAERPLPPAAGTPAPRSEAASAGRARAAPPEQVKRPPGGPGEEQPAAAPEAAVAVPPTRPAAESPRPPSGEPPRPAVGHELPPVESQRPATGESSSSPLELRQLLSVWDQVRIEIEDRHPELAPLFREATPIQHENPGTFLVEVRNEFYFRQMKTTQRQEAFLSLVREVARQPWKAAVRHEGKVILINGAGARNDALLDSKPAAGGRSRAGQEGAPETAAQGARPERLANNPIVKKSVDLFGGRVI